MVIWAVAASVAAGLVAAGLPSTAVATTAAGAAVPTIGTVTDLSWGISPADMDRTVSQLVAAGVRSVRVNANWSALEQGGKGVIDAGSLASLDAAVTKARSAGLEVLMPISDGVPYWASADPNKVAGSWNKMWRPTNMSDYGDIVGFVARRFSPLGVNSYEMWNEPNHPRFWPSGVSAPEYTAMLRAGSTAVRQTNTAAKVVLGGLAKSDSTFLTTLYAAGAGPLFDVAAIHPYTGSVAPNVCWTDASGRKAQDAFCGIEAVRDVMVANGDQAKPLWLTEFGWSTSTATYGVTEDQQAAYLTDAYNWLSSRSYVTNTFWYNFRNTYWMGDDPSQFEANFGLLRTNYTAKPAYAAFTAVAARQATPDGTTTTTTVPTTTSTTNKRPPRR